MECQRLASPNFSHPRVVVGFGSCYRQSSLLIRPTRSIGAGYSFNDARRRQRCCAGNGAASVENNAAGEAEAGLSVRCDLSDFPQCNFFRIEAVFRPWRMNAIIARLSNEGIRGMTASSVHGMGMQGGGQERYSGTEFGSEDLVEKGQLCIVCTRDQVDTIATAIVEASRTGEVGDGKIFVYPVADVIRIRTGERGLEAEHMEGGMRDLMLQAGDD